MLLLLAGGCGLLAVLFLGRAIGTPWRQRRATLKRARAYGVPAKAPAHEVARDRLSGRVEHAVDLLSRAGRRLAMPGFRETVDIRLLQAGFSARVTARDTFAAKV